MDINQLINLLYDTKLEMINFKSKVKEREAKKILSKYLTDIEEDLEVLNQMEKEGKEDKELFLSLEKKYTRIYSSITNKVYVPVEAKKNKKTKIEVKEVIPSEQQTEKEQEEIKKGNSKLKKVLITTGIAALIISIILFSKNYNINIASKDIDDNTEISTEDNNEEESEVIVTTNEMIAQIINDDVKLLNYVNELITKYNIGYSANEVIQMIKLANFDILDNNDTLTSREKVLETSEELGQVLNKVPSDEFIYEDVNADIYISKEELSDILKNVTNDAISPIDFKDAASQENYNIYKVYEICINNLDNEDQTKAFNYAKIINDILARFTLDFSLCPDAPIDTYYTLFGMYNANKETISNLTAGQKLSTIYGNGYQNDDTYGYICVEELLKYASYDNEDNMFYTFIIDDNIINNGITK